VKHESECEWPRYITTIGGWCEMGDRRSFHIESKRFDLVLGYVGRNQFRMSERSTYHRSMIYMSKEGARWLGRCVEENVVREGEKAFVRTLREHDKTFVCRRYSNKYGRYIEVLECGRGGSRERIVIPEGYKLNGWKGFSMELNLLLKPLPLTRQVLPQKPHLLTGGERTSEKGVVVGGNSKSYKEVVMDRKHEREVRLEPKKPVTKPVQSDGLLKNPVEEHVETAVSGYGGSGANVDQTKRGINIPPQISANIKPRQPLRFFPDVLPGNSRNLGKGIVIQLNEMGQRCVFWKSKEKEQQWVPREPIKNKTEFVNAEIQNSVSNRGKPVDVGSVGEYLGFESRPTYEAGVFWDTEDFGLEFVFEVGSSSGYKECGPHGSDMDGSQISDGSQILDSGQPLKVGVTKEENSLELLGIAGSLTSTALEFRSTASLLVEWVDADGGSVDADGGFWRSWWGLAGVNFKVRLFTIPLPVPIPFFSYFQPEREGIEAWLVGLAGGTVTRCGAWVGKSFVEDGMLGWVWVLMREGVEVP
jgi:hypothetical protein